MPAMRRFAALLFLPLLFTACQPEPADPAPPVQPTALADAAPLPDEFADYWYQGEAEITSYTLEQARYGALHDGHAVLIYVTEDFSREKHVKLDYPNRASEQDKVNVLKLNFTKHFNTGIYPYAMMSSIFTPVQRQHPPHTLKVTTSVQEWCGHVFVQMNRRRDGYAIEQRSYFESEGDRELSLKAPLEDDLWTQIRLAPAALPTGEVELIPGTQYLRLSHEDWRIHTATATLAPRDGHPEQQAYTLTYPDLGRTLTIHFNRAFPHEIEGWAETYRSRGETLTTTATRNRRIKNAYWNYNSPEDERLRAELGL